MKAGMEFSKQGQGASQAPNLGGPGCQTIVQVARFEDADAKTTQEGTQCQCGQHIKHNMDRPVDTSQML